MSKKEINLGELADLLAEGPAGQEKLKKQAKAIAALQETLMLSYKRQKPYEVPVKSDGNMIRFGVIGDTQFGSLYGLRDALRAFYERCAAEGVMDILHAGDVIDGWRVYKGQEFELRPDGKSWPEQRDIFRNEVPRIPGMRTIFITGNHDASFKNLVGMNVGDELSRVREDWKFVGQDVGDVELQTKSGLKFRVRMLHPGGGTAYAVSYHAQKIVESLPGGTKPNLLVIGHYHKALHMPSYRNVDCILPGCFQSQTPFMTRQSIAAHMGGWIVTVHLGDPKKLTDRISAEFIRFFEEKA
jgi:DNA polymerase II small subunit/DNA polymerase delta subunit B